LAGWCLKQSLARGSQPPVTRDWPITDPMLLQGLGMIIMKYVVSCDRGNVLRQLCLCEWKEQMDQKKIDLLHAVRYTFQTAGNLFGCMILLKLSPEKQAEAMHWCPCTVPTFDDASRQICLGWPLRVRG